VFAGNHWTGSAALGSGAYQEDMGCQVAMVPETDSAMSCRAMGSRMDSVGCRSSGLEEMCLLVSAMFLERLGKLFNFYKRWVTYIHLTRRIRVQKIFTSVELAGFEGDHILHSPFVFRKRWAWPSIVYLFLGGLYRTTLA
jgi:hypothetical protein